MEFSIPIIFMNPMTLANIAIVMVRVVVIMMGMMIGIGGAALMRPLLNEKFSPWCLDINIHTLVVSRD